MGCDQGEVSPKLLILGGLQVQVSLKPFYPCDSDSFTRRDVSKLSPVYCDSGHVGLVWEKAGQPTREGRLERVQ